MTQPQRKHGEAIVGAIIALALILSLKFVPWPINMMALAADNASTLLLLPGMIIAALVGASVAECPTATFSLIAAEVLTMGIIGWAAALILAGPVFHVSPDRLWIALVSGLLTTTVLESYRLIWRYAR